MATYTPNLGMMLPAGSENVSRVYHLNGNLEIIDTAIGALPSGKNVVGLIGGKISEPTTEGTNGQVLGTDGNGGRAWIDLPDPDVATTAETQAMIDDYYGG